MKLNRRLRLIAESIPRCGILADGYDHAYIPIYAIKESACERAMTDIRPALSVTAQKNIRKQGWKT